ncbi:MULTISPECIES: aldose epimerase family protein [unclassified Breznakia]|uniref:aldose epimerase family protein n=1 Tax=unclassified Breznakia TaxID=2623764 RepID=UPI002475FB17|nr:MULTISPECIES: aldose epimerase family protein [unclassified Breznakia]MDH6366955.1 aldose 1-epimerase [Breznakia sp. PH1-1]MDH6404133.1 aldose 1-epimerase [Breznakia sp. PF1-11]MDH6411842.1 aldose 1-epimerase [Breznakia sp. PFB1-11]MDH6414121.1 aldose 1-epimerase [Breznakia sp. PFB1-14]MDH6416522.1 aldose 1-epimerase [Breznakia sp. PFB1-4]
MNIHNEVIDKKRNILLYTLENEYLTIKITNLGASIVSVMYKDGTDVVLGYDDILSYDENPNYFGATIGRCANRIANATFSLDGKDYELYPNDGIHSLHGGKEGFNKKIFHATTIANGVSMQYLSADGEEGYPGDLDVQVVFQLDKETLSISYHATPSKDTLINLTNHMYFALQGEGNGSIEYQTLQVQASTFMENQTDHLATGKIASVQGRPHDFRTTSSIVDALQHDEDEQIKTCDGFDNFFMFDEDQRKEVIVKDAKSGNKLIVKTDLPGFHLYVPNYEPAIQGKQNHAYLGNCALCIETSYAPDAIHNQEHPDVICKANEPFVSTTSYTFTKS